MKILMDCYLDIKKEINNFYEDDFESDNDEFYANKNIKNKIIDFICDAKNNNNFEMMKKFIELLSENTGCVEDVEILDSLLNGQDDIKKEILANSPIARWFE